VPGSPEVVYPPPLGAPASPPPAAPERDALGRVSPQQVLLAVGAVALVAAGAASLGGTGWALQIVLAVATTAASLVCGRRGLRTSEETLAAATVVLLLLVVGERACSPATGEVVLAVLAAVFLVLGRIGRSAVTWPIGSWAAAQLAVLTALTGLDLTPGVQHVSALLLTAVAGTAVALVGRRPVSRVALVTTAGWWLVGVAQGIRLVWTTTSVPTAAVAATLLLAAAAGLAALRLNGDLRGLLGPRPVVPVLSGVVAGAAVAGVLQSAGPAGAPAAGYLGLGIAALVAEFASPRPESLVRPTGLALASTATVLAVAQLLADGRWSALGVLLLAAAVPALLVAARQPVDRPGALPVTVGCLAGAALLFEADGRSSAAATGVALLALAVAALGAATLERHHRAEVPLAVSGLLVGLLAAGHLGRSGDATELAGALAVLGAALTGYASRTGRVPARAAGCTGLLAAAWLAAAEAGVQLPEAYTLPAAAAMLLFSGKRLLAASSWSAWGPALVTGFGPSTVLALVEPDPLRVVLVVLAATLAMTSATGWATQAPLVVGAASLMTVAVGRLLAALPLVGLLALVLAGAALVAVGASYESRRQRARAAIARVAQMR